MKKSSVLFLLITATALSLHADENPIHPNEREALRIAQVVEAVEAQERQARRHKIIGISWGIVAGSFIAMQAYCAYSHLQSK